MPAMTVTRCCRRWRTGRSFGRGSFDMKSGVAAMMVAAAKAAKQGLSGDILVACVADEEYASIGTAEVARHFKADAAIVTEPSHLELTLAHKGFVWFDVIVEGTRRAWIAAGHRHRCDHEGRAFPRGARGSWPKAARRKRPSRAAHRIGARLDHQGRRGIVELSRDCRISIERRTIPGETGDSVEEELSAILDGIARSGPRFPLFVGARPRARAFRGEERRADRRLYPQACDRGSRSHAENSRRAFLDRLRHPEGGRHPLAPFRRGWSGRACGDRMGLDRKRRDARAHSRAHRRSNSAPERKITI